MSNNKDANKDRQWFFSHDQCDFCNKMLECICIDGVAVCKDCAQKTLQDKKCSTEFENFKNKDLSNLVVWSLVGFTIGVFVLFTIGLPLAIMITTWGNP